MVAIGSATPLPVFSYVKDVGKSGLGTLREKSTWATRQEVDGRRLLDTAGSARGGFDGGRQVCRGRDCGWLCRRQRFIASGKTTIPAQNPVARGFEMRFSIARAFSDHVA